jgi:hypothetical protein
MNTTIKIALAIVAIFCLTTSVRAQIEGQEERIQLRAAEKVAQMNDYISKMADKSNSLNFRLRRKEKALNLFVGKGYEYIENGVEKEGVQMQVTSKNRTKVGQPLMRDYFDNLVGKKLDKMYDNVHIEATEVARIKVSELQKLDENLWECTCEYDQAFVGYRDGRPVYRDITTKRIKCYVIAEDTEDGWEFIILLGDVYAIKTR